MDSEEIFQQLSCGAKFRKPAQSNEEKVTTVQKSQKISTVGSSVPKPIESFEELASSYNVSQNIIKNILESGFTKPTPIQMQTIPCMLQKRQVLACAPTGSGKTAAFLIPLIHSLSGPKKMGFRAVIVSPTRELAKQTFRECVRLSEGTHLKTHIISKVGHAAEKYGPNSSQKFDILVTTPNRLVYLLQEEPPALSLKNVEWLVIDESDKLFEAGPRGFRDQLAVIYLACNLDTVKRAMFSATYSTHVAKWCKKNLKKLITITIGHRNTTAGEVKQELLFVGNEEGKLLAFRDLAKQGLSPPVLVFVQSKERAQELYEELLYDGINVDVIHADRTQLQRDNVVRAFREGKIWVLICTELMGRGIDFKGVNMVVNYDFPLSAVSYIHRIGRTGRAGRSGRAITFFTTEDTARLRSIAIVMKDSGCNVPDYMLKLKKPKKSDRQKLEHIAPERKKISTVPSYEKFKQHKKKIKMLNKKLREKGASYLPDARILYDKYIPSFYNERLEEIKKKSDGEKLVLSCDETMDRMGCCEFAVLFRTLATEQQTQLVFVDVYCFRGCEHKTLLSYINNTIFCVFFFLTVFRDKLYGSFFFSFFFLILKINLFFFIWINNFDFSFFLSSLGPTINTLNRTY